MRIAIDGRALTGRFTGDRTYWFNLLRTLLRRDSENTYLIYTRTPLAPDILPPTPNLICRTIEAANERMWTLHALPRAAREDRATVMHVQYTVPLRSPCPVITTVHDISFRLQPQWFPAKHRLLLNLTVPGSMRRAQKVITISESSRQDILRVYHLPPEKLIAIPLGLPEGFTEARQENAPSLVKAKFGLTQPYILAVGVLQPRKNLLFLAEAFGMAKSEHNLPHQLALVGKAGWGTEQDVLRQAAAKHGGQSAAEAVVFPGYVEDADLPAVYQASSLFAYPSLYEGFGFPPLEAMASGVPVVVSDAPAMPEVVGEAALILPATDTKAWADGIFRALNDTGLRNRLMERGRERVGHFSWEKTAQRTLEIYRSVA